MIMNNYETIVILNANLSEEESEGLVNKFKSLIDGAGKVESVDAWGKRRLAYEINDEKEGNYVLINFSADPQFPRELERVYKITDGVLKHIIINKDR